MMKGHVRFFEHPRECFNDGITSALCWDTVDTPCVGWVMRPSEYASAFQNNNLHL